MFPVETISGTRRLDSVLLDEEEKGRNHPSAMEWRDLKTVYDIRANRYVGGRRLRSVKSSCHKRLLCSLSALCCPDAVE